MEMFTCVVKINDLNGILEIVAGNVPNPFGAVADKYGFSGKGITSFHSLGAQARAEIGDITEGCQVSRPYRSAI